VEWTKAAAGPLPELRDVRVVVDDRHQPLVPVIVFEDAIEDRVAGDICLRRVIEIVDLEKCVSDAIVIERFSINAVERSSRV
jgi:hypothetical protein